MANEIAGKGILSVAGGILRAVRRGVQGFVDDLQQELTEGVRPLPPPPPLEQARREVVIHQFQRDFDDRTALINKRLVEGDIRLSQWQGLIGIEIRTLHLSAAVTAVGGFANLTPSILLEVERTVQIQLNYLRAWAQQLAGQMTTLDGAPDELSETQLNNRVKLYGGASNATFQKQLVASYGVPELPFYPAERTDCMTNCGCAWDIVQLEGEGNYDCFWRRGKTDSCNTCRYRERVANPLQVRGGALQGRWGNEAFSMRAKVWSKASLIYNLFIDLGKEHHHEH